MIKSVDLYHQYESIRGEIDAAIQETIRNSSFIGGRAHAEFEKAFAAFQSAAYCVGVANGTDAIEIALEALDLPVDSEVIVPANSFISSAEPASRRGHRVVFADIDPATYTLDLQDVERRITPRTKAIIAVHLYGHPCDMNGLMALARRQGIRVIEDCAQAHGAEYAGRRIGAIGDIGSFSFFPGKNLGAYGDAGAITTDDDALATRCRMIANHGRLSKYNHAFAGRNSRLDGLQAAILAVKLRYLEQWTNRRIEIAHRYLEALRGVGDLVLPVIRPEARHVFHLFVIRTQRRDKLKAHLEKAGVESGVHYPISLPKLPAYEHLGQGAEPMRANDQDKTLLSLPNGEHLSNDDVDKVAAAVKDFFR